MPSVRYYDYGVIRRESDQRMLDAQRRSALWDIPMHRVTPDVGEQTRPAEGSLSINLQDAKECKDEAVVTQTDGSCVTSDPDKGRIDCGEPQREQKGISMSGEELLIAALLILAISEGCELPLILALFYLML